MVPVEIILVVVLKLSSTIVAAFIIMVFLYLFHSVKIRLETTSNSLYANIYPSKLKGCALRDCRYLDARNLKEMLDKLKKTERNLNALAYKRKLAIEQVRDAAKLRVSQS